MATSNSRDVRLGIEIQTAGEDSVKRLASVVRGLAQEGDPAATEYKRLADELDRLAQQAGAIQSLKTLTADVSALTVAEQAAATAAERATVAYREQAEQANALREKQALARAEAAQAKTAYDDLKLAFQTLKNEGRGAEETQAKFNARLRESRQVVDEQNRALRTRRDTLAEANRAVTEATKVETALRREFEATSRAAESTGGALRAQVAQLSQLQTAAAGLGAEITDLDAAEQRLLATTQEYVAQVGAKRKQVSLEQADADHLAAIEARGLAVAQRDAAEAAAGELASVKESLQFIRDQTKARADAARATAALADAEEKRVARQREQAAADREAYQALDGLTEARQRARVAAESELAAIKESEQFIEQEARAKREAVAATLALAEADEKAAVAAREFAAAEAAAAAQFSKLADQAAVANLFAQRLYDVEQAAAASALQTKRLAEAGEAVKTAFGQTGVRSLQAIRAEMTGVGQSLGLLQRQYNAGAIGADDLARATSSAQVRLATLRQELQTIPALPNAFEKINSSINSLISRFGSLTAAVATVGFAVKPVLDAGIAFETLRRTLNEVTGSAAATADLIEFLRRTSDQAGISAGQLANGFSLFAASLSKSGISIEDTKNLFEGVAGAAGKLGLSTDKVNGILTALGQVANKGKVSLEELQGQVGEALPGALKLSADSLGITTAQLQGLLKEGKLLAEDFLPAFGKQLQETFGSGEKPVTGLAQAFNRLKNQATEASQRLVDTSAYRGLANTLDALAGNFDTVLGGLGSLAKGFVAFKAIDAAREFFGIKAAIEAASASKLKDVEVSVAQTATTRASAAAIEVETAALATNTAARAANTAATKAGAATGALAALETGLGKVAGGAAGAASKIGSFVAALGGPYGAALAVAYTFSEQLGNGLAYVAAKLTGSVDALKRNEEALRQQAEALKASGEAARANAEATNASFIKLQVQYDQQLVAADNQIKVSEKLLKAKKDEGDAAVKLAELSGDETLAKNAAAAASNSVLRAVSNELAARQSEINLLEEERAALVVAAGAQETWTTARREFFVDFDQKLAKKKADLEITKQQTAVEAEAADKAFAVAQAFKDNAARVDEYRAAVESAEINVKALTAALAEGLTTQERVDAATRELAVANALLKDSYADATAALQRRSAVLKESAGLAGQEIDIRRRGIQVDLEIAESTGQYANRVQALIDLKQLDVEATRLSIQTNQEQASLLRQQADLAQQELKTGDAQYAQKQRQIDALRNSAKSIENEGRAQQESLRGMETALGVLNGTLFKGVQGIDAMSTAMRNLRVETDEAAAAQKRLADSAELGRQATEYVNSPQYQLNQKLNQGTLGAADVPAAQQNLDVAQFNFRTAQQNLTQYSTAGYQSMLQEYIRARRILEEAQKFNSPLSTDGAATPASGPSRQVVITINGKPTTVEVANEKEADTLTAILKRIGDAANRTGP